jgi:hypothetical protein
MNAKDRRGDEARGRKKRAEASPDRETKMSDAVAEANRLADAADKAIDRALEGDNRAFIESTRQQGGE